MTALALAETGAVCAPPQNLEAEQSVLGALLMGAGGAGDLFANGLRPEHFYRLAHGEIYRAMLDLDARSEPVDVLTVCDRLERGGRLEELGGRPAIESLAVAVPALAHVGQYARIVRENALLRALLDHATRVQQRVLERSAPAEELLEQAQHAAMDLSAERAGATVTRIDEAIGRELDRLGELARAKTAITGLPTGFVDLDEALGGLQPKSLVLVAARPGIGKSALAANVAVHAAAVERRPTLMFSLEMSEPEVAGRALCAEASVPTDRLRKPARLSQAEWQRFYRAAAGLDGVPLYLCEAASVSLADVRARARWLAVRHRNEGGLGLVVVDYLQLMRADRQANTRSEEVGAFSRGLKQLARELDCPILALSQLNRALEQRNDKRPTLSDLRDSGELEQDADVVAFLYREDYYDPDSRRRGEADLLIRKNRTGGPGHLDIPLVFDAPHTRFRSLAAHHLASA